VTRYAQNTEVSADRSKTEIERTLQRFGADQFAYGWDETQALIGFRIAGRSVRMTLILPSPDDRMFSRTPTGRRRTQAAATEEYNREVRRRWRALAVVIKAKLVAVSEGISTVEREFLSDMVLPSGQTLGDWAVPQLDTIRDSGQVPALLPGSAR
jgi:hypothetical protein